MASSVQELWDVLNKGNMITDGTIRVWYKGGYIDSDPEIENPMIWSQGENYTLWEEFVEEEEEVEITTEQLYCRWYVERADGSFEIDNGVWNTVEKEPYENHFRMNEAFSKFDIVGAE